MYRLIRFLFTGRWELPPICSHIWEIIDERSYVYFTGGAVHKKRKLQCAECGDIKHDDSDK